jgi:hypothetical protein
MIILFLRTGGSRVASWWNAESAKKKVMKLTWRPLAPARVASRQGFMFLFQLDN